MLKHVELSSLDDYFMDVGKRRNRGVFFYRINGYNQQIRNFIRRYYNAAKIDGIIIEGNLHNPDSNNLAYYNEIVGTNFQMSNDYIRSSLEKWLPRMNAKPKEDLAEAIFDVLSELRRVGKNDNVLKNIYIKFMCWLYFKFECIVNHLGNEKLPKILYEGIISNYELLFLTVLSMVGCDIVLLQYDGEEEYLKIDETSSKSIELKMPSMVAFPHDFNIKQIRLEIQEELNNDRLYGDKPQATNCTNAWITGRITEDVLKDTSSRGTDSNFFYNCFCRISGVEDRSTYLSELNRLQRELKQSNRRLVIINEQIQTPSFDEIGKIHRSNYKNVNQLISDLNANIRAIRNQELQRIVNKAFVDIILEESRKDSENIYRLTNKAVYLLCWLRRYQQQLFDNWRRSEIGCFFFMGGCKTENEALFCRFLARLPVDVIIFKPDLSQVCCLEDKLLYEVKYDQSLSVTKYPEENTVLQVGTAAYHAERDLDTLMYQDSGMYRNQQYEKATSVLLQTMYEEISVLWDQELKYRPNFNIVDDTVNIPVIFAKISGVKNRSLTEYWSTIRNFLTPDTRLIRKVPNIASTDSNPIKVFATEFYRNGKLQKNTIKKHKSYQYGFLRESMQDHLLDKLQFMIDQKLIKGTCENGTEYTIISTALNLDKDILRLIQKFDFTKKNPKLIYIIPGETLLSLEDTIYASYLNQVGFDVLFFVPTGYQCIEQHLNGAYLVEHQIGEYMYDLNIPDFDKISTNEKIRSAWRNIFFKR